MGADELLAWLRLTLTPGIGNVGARRLLARFGLPQDIFLQGLSTLSEAVPSSLAQALLAPPPGLDAQFETTWRWLHGAQSADASQEHVQQAPKGSNRIVTLGDASYPASLLQMEDPPLLLYVMGRGLLQPAEPQTLAATARPPARPVLRQGIAIVGSRNPTPQGESNARQFARALAGSGLTVISGLALGVDGAAHGGALEASSVDGPHMPTVAVVGTGLDRVYPRQHLALARKICERGLIVSEYPLGTPPIAENFPRRNRLIAGLASGTLVVEAALQSGSLITARLTVEQGKDVFAIPGSIHSSLSRGCHALIKQGAKLVESAQDILEELQLVPPSSPDSGSADPMQEDGGSDQDLLKWLGHDPVGLDQLVARSGIGASQWQVHLLTLELEGRVARLPGGLYQRIGQA
jgi:DNA processing protein